MGKKMVLLATFPGISKIKLLFPHFIQSIRNCISIMLIFPTLTRGLGTISPRQLTNNVGVLAVLPGTGPAASDLVPGQRSPASPTANYASSTDVSPVTIFSVESPRISSERWIRTIEHLSAGLKVMCPLRMFKIKTRNKMFN